MPLFGSRPNSPESRNDVLIDYRLRAPDHDRTALIKRFYEIIEYPHSMQPGNLAHLSGLSDEGIVFMSVWDSPVSAERAYSDLQAPIAQTIAEFGGGVEVDRAVHPAYMFTKGSEADRFGPHSPANSDDCVTYRIDVPIHGRKLYDTFLEKMEFPDTLPEGLLMHVAGDTDEGWRTYSVWETVEQSLTFMRDRIIPAGLAVVQEQALFPEIRPVEIDTMLFALNAPDR